MTPEERKIPKVQLLNYRLHKARQALAYYRDEVAHMERQAATMLMRINMIKRVAYEQGIELK